MSHKIVQTLLNSSEKYSAWRSRRQDRLERERVASLLLSPCICRCGCIVFSKMTLQCTGRMTPIKMTWSRGHQSCWQTTYHQSSHQLLTLYFSILYWEVEQKKYEKDTKLTLNFLDNLSPNILDYITSFCKQFHNTTFQKVFKKRFDNSFSNMKA